MASIEANNIDMRNVTVFIYYLINFVKWHIYGLNSLYVGVFFQLLTLMICIPFLFNKINCSSRMNDSTAHRVSLAAQCP